MASPMTTRSTSSFFASSFTRFLAREISKKTKAKETMATATFGASCSIIAPQRSESGSSATMLKLKASKAFLPTGC